MTRPLAVFHRKPTPPITADRLARLSPHDAEPSFRLELEHRVWLARFAATAPDPGQYPWDDYQAELCLPEVWQSGPDAERLSTTGFGGPFPPGGLGAVFGDGPIPGDRVLAYRSAADEVVGVWVVTGGRTTGRGEIRLGVRPLVSLGAPVRLADDRSVDADLATRLDGWLTPPGGGADADLVLLDGPGLSALVRTVGIDPLLLCGPADRLPDCSLTNCRPDGGYRPAARLTLADSLDAHLDRCALGEAVDWLLGHGSPSAVGTLQGSADDVETVNLGGGRGWCLVARNGHGPRGGLQEVVAVGVSGADLADVSLCPSVVHEAEVAAADDRHWALVLTLIQGDQRQVIWLDALAVALCFDRFSGRLAPV